VYTTAEDTTKSSCLPALATKESPEMKSTLKFKSEYYICLVDTFNGVQLSYRNKAYIASARLVSRKAFNNVVLGVHLAELGSNVRAL